ncbi:MAG: hypothetical protein SFU99_18325 [Saprospiraceae bacterium]|nr:hypothetical protein [Saprospiraceae bacterium]
MPVRTKYLKTIWCPGPWPWEWFRTCEVERDGWEYNFQRLKAQGLLYYHYTGCENGIEYQWDDWGSLIQPGEFPGVTTVIQEEELPKTGKCDPNNIGTYSQRLDLVVEIIVSSKIEVIKSEKIDINTVIPDDTICNRSGNTITTWTVQKDNKIVFTASKFYDFMFWSINGKTLIPTSGKIIVDGIPISYSMPSKEELILNTEGTYGNFSISVQLIAVLNNNPFRSKIVFEQNISIIGQSKDGDQSYIDYLACKKHIEDVFKKLWPEVPPVLKIPSDPLKVINTFNNQMDELKTSFNKLANQQKKQ